MINRLSFASKPALVQAIPLTDRELRQISSHLARAVTELHRCGIIHKDIVASLLP